MNRRRVVGGAPYVLSDLKASTFLLIINKKEGTLLLLVLISESIV